MKSYNVFIDVRFESSSSVTDSPSLIRKTTDYGSILAKNPTWNAVFFKANTHLCDVVHVFPSILTCHPTHVHHGFERCTELLLYTDYQGLRETNTFWKKKKLYSPSIVAHNRGCCILEYVGIGK